MGKKRTCTLFCNPGCLSRRLGLRDPQRRKLVTEITLSERCVPECGHDRSEAFAPAWVAEAGLWVLPNKATFTAGIREHAGVFRPRMAAAVAKRGARACRTCALAFGKNTQTVARRTAIPAPLPHAGRIDRLRLGGREALEAARELIAIRPPGNATWQHDLLTVKRLQQIEHRAVLVL